VLVFRATSERLKDENVTQALKRFGELQQLQLPFLMARRAKGCHGSGSTTQGNSQVLLFPVTPGRLTLSKEPMSCTVLC